LYAASFAIRWPPHTKTPIAVLIAANTINLLFDVILIAYLGLGPLGAAIATTTAEWISAALFLLVLAGKIPSPTGERRPVPILPVRSVPSLEDLKPLLVASSAIFFRSLTLQISLSTAAALAARGAAPSVAAHLLRCSSRSKILVEPALPATDVPSWPEANDVGIARIETT
jgi:Na+-driven multidrug efflux pump